MSKLTYLACPYSHRFSWVMQERFEAVNKAAAKLMHSGEYVFSPISHTHPIALAGDMPRGWEYWEPYDRTILAACGKVIVLRLQGWTESKGVAGEIAIAEEMGIPIEYIDP